MTEQRPADGGHNTPRPGYRIPSPFIVEEPAEEWGVLRAAPSAVVGGLLKAYRKVISPIYGDVCKFFPTCSAYALEAVTVHGAAKGSVMAAARITRCHPWQSGGLDPVKPGRRKWTEGKLPRIIELNHPEVPVDPTGPEN